MSVGVFVPKQVRALVCLAWCTGCPYHWILWKYSTSDSCALFLLHWGAAPVYNQCQNRLAMCLWCAFIPHRSAHSLSPPALRQKEKWLFILPRHPKEKFPWIFFLRRWHAVTCTDPEWKTDVERVVTLGVHGSSPGSRLAISFEWRWSSWLWQRSRPEWRRPLTATVSLITKTANTDLHFTANLSTGVICHFSLASALRAGINGHWREDSHVRSSGTVKLLRTF